MTSNDVIYLKAPDGALQPLVATAYDTEAILQAYLENHPDLLAGSQMRRNDPVRFLLVRREMPVPDDTGVGRWSLDHLYIDQYAVPTFVEVKRSTNTEIRRQVIAQMLDYVANGQLYWSAQTLLNEFVKTCGATTDPSVLLAEFLGADTAPAAFFEKVIENLESGRVRLLFVADEIPPELRRIVEFLNAQMSDADVLAVEVKQYVGGEHTTFVPRVLGITTKSESTKTGSGAEKFDDYCLEGTPCWEVKMLLEGWAAAEGLTHRVSPWSWQVFDGATPLLSLWSTTTQLYLHRLVRAGLESDVAELRSKLQAASKSPLTEQKPAIKNTDVIQSWDTWHRVLLPEYLGLVRRMVQGSTGPTSFDGTGVG